MKIQNPIPADTVGSAEPVGKNKEAKMTEPLGYVNKPLDEQNLRVAIEAGLNKHHMVVTREPSQR